MKLFSSHCHQSFHCVQEMFCKQKGYLEEELDYRKQALDQAYMVNVPSETKPGRIMPMLLLWIFTVFLVYDIIHTSYDWNV